MCGVRGHKRCTLHIMGNQAAVAVRQCIACRVHYPGLSDAHVMNQGMALEG